MMSGMVSFQSSSVQRKHGWHPRGDRPDRVPVPESDREEPQELQGRDDEDEDRREDDAYGRREDDPYAPQEVPGVYSSAIHLGPPL